MRDAAGEEGLLAALAELPGGELEPRPLSHARNLHPRFYSDPRIAAWERRALFDTSWQLAGAAERLAQPGSYLVEPVLGEEVVLTRDAGGEIHALENVCRHRAGPLAVGSGCAEELVCRYHGWRYGLEGGLRAAPGFGPAAGFDPARVRLGARGVHAWCGLLFVHLDRAAGSAGLQAILDALRGRLGPLHAPERYRFGHRQRYAVECNWKVYVDNYLEGYHLPLVHPGLSAQLRVADYRSELGDGYSVQTSPLDQALTRGQRPEGEACYAHVFPNLLLNFLPGRLQTNVVWPRDVDRCEVCFDYYYDPAVDEAEREADRASSHQTQIEDMEICAAVQRNLRSGRYRGGRLSPTWEAAVWGFQNWIRGRLAEAPAGA